MLLPLVLVLDVIKLELEFLELQVALLHLLVNKVRHHSIRELRLRDSHGYDFYARSIVFTTIHECLTKVVVQEVELVDDYLVEGLARAELVDFVVYLVEDPGLVVVHRVILDGFPCVLLL